MLKLRVPVDNHSFAAEREKESARARAREKTLEISEWSRLPAVWLTAVGRGKHARVERQTKMSTEVVFCRRMVFRNIAEARQWGTAFAKKERVPFISKVPSAELEKNKRGEDNG